VGVDDLLAPQAEPEAAEVARRDAALEAPKMRRS